MAEVSGRDFGGNALPPAVSSAASEGRPRVPPAPPEGGEKILRVSFRENAF